MSDEPARLGKYEIIRTLGHGAMGVVYEGLDRVIERRVAIKTVRTADLDADEAAEHSRRFLIEARAAGKLNHPHIVSLFDHGEQDGTAFLVMELVVGRELQQWFDDARRFSVAETLRLMGELLDALGYSHRQGVIHRDVKPANIFITESGTLKLGDFGIARIESAQKTRAGLALGTPTHMAPEQIRGETADARSDLYAAGVVLFQLLTGGRPFSGTMLSMALKVLNDPAPLPSSLDPRVTPALDAVVSKALAKAADQRYPSAEAFWQALTRAAGSVDASPGRLGPASATTPASAGSPTGSAAARAAPAAASREIPLPVVEPPGAKAALPAARSSSNGRRTLYALFGACSLAVLIGATWWLGSRQPTAPVAGSEPVLNPASTGRPAAATSTPAQPLASVPPPARTVLTDGGRPEASAARDANEAPLPAPSTAPTSPVLPTPLPAVPQAGLSRSTTGPSTALGKPPSTPARQSESQRVAKTAAARDTNPPMPADATVQSSRPTPTRTALPAKCSDILLKASLEPLTVEESRYLRRECQ